LTDEQLASSSEDEFFLDAISAYAERALERDRVEFKLMWKTNPKLAFSELFGSDLQR
jgi:hypothetical protein